MKTIVKKHRPRGVGESVLIGLGISVVCSVLIMMFLAYCIENEYMNITKISIMSFVILLISSFMGAFGAGVVAKEKKIIACAGAVGAYYVVLMTIAVVVFDGVRGGALLGFLACTIGFGGASLLSLKEKSRSKIRKVRGRSR